MLNRIFSHENAKRLGVRIVEAYTSCPKSTGEDHKVFFIVETSNADTVRRFFSPMVVDVRQITPYSEAVTK